MFFVSTGTQQNYSVLWPCIPLLMSHHFYSHDGLLTLAVDVCCRSQKRNIMQWRNTHHCNRLQTPEQHEALGGERTLDTAAVSPRVGSSGISLRQPKFSSDVSPALVAQTNWTFVEKLLKVSC